MGMTQTAKLSFTKICANLEASSQLEQEGQDITRWVEDVLQQCLIWHLSPFGFGRYSSSLAIPKAHLMRPTRACSKRRAAAGSALSLSADCRSARMFLRTLGLCKMASGGMSANAPSLNSCQNKLSCQASFSTMCYEGASHGSM